MFYLTTHSTHFIYSYMASDHSSDTGCQTFGNTFLLIAQSARDLLHALSHGQDISLPLIYQLRGTGWNDEKPQSENGSLRCFDSAV